MATDPSDDMNERDPLDDLDASLRALIADATLWENPSDPEHLEELVVAAIDSEVVHPPERVAGRTGSSRLRHVLIGAAAAVAALFGGIVVFSALGSSSESEVLALELVPTGRAGDAGGSIDLVDSPSGLRIDLEAPGLPERTNGTYYEAWLKTSDGELVPCGTFHAGYKVTLWAGVDLDDVRAFTITIEKMTDASNPDQASSGDVVLKAEVPEQR